LKAKKLDKAKLLKFLEKELEYNRVMIEHELFEKHSKDFYDGWNRCLHSILGNVDSGDFDA